MFVIFGWNKEEIENLGGVEQNYCSNCHNTLDWQLTKISHYFTVFFLPIFPHDSFYWLHCPVCNHGFKLLKNEGIDYVEIANVKSKFRNKEITLDQERLSIDVIQKRIIKKREEEHNKVLIESNKWSDMASKKSMDELYEILNDKPRYNPAFFMAVEAEINKRRLK